ncbi:MAG: hypothetical protein ACRD7E_22310 [Bryobacteraceae bacterium]
MKSIPQQPDWVYSVRFAPDGKTFAAGRYDGSVSLYDAENFHDLNEVRKASR